MRKYLPFTIAKSFKFNYVNHGVADFETCFIDNEKTDVRVWAWGYADIQTGEYKTGNNIDSFLDFVLSGKEVFDIGFHNLRFDGSFIIPQLFMRGYTYLNNTDFMKKWQDGEPMTKYFTHNITAMGQWFSVIVVKDRPANKSTPSFVHFWDTLKLFPSTLREVALQYHLPVTKINEDREFYERIRPVGHTLTQEESEYLKADCMILVGALRSQLDKYGTLHRTRASKAFYYFKSACTDQVGNNNYKQKYEGIQQYKVPRIKGLEDYADMTIRYLPPEVKRKIRASGEKLEEAFEYYIPDFYTWQDFKRAYTGGISYVNPEAVEQDIKETVTVLDVNSMYPSRLRDCLIPYGRYEKIKGAPDKSKRGVWVACARVSFRLKESYMLPCIQLKERYGRKWLHCSTDYMQYGELDKYNEDVLYFSSVDFETYQESYEFTVHEWYFTYHFQNVSNMDGKKFVDVHYKEKQKADNVMSKIKKNKPDTYATDNDYITAQLNRTEAKIIMNSAYGKHGTKYFLLSKDSVYIPGEPVQYIPSNKLNKEPMLEPSHYYIPYALFVTAYARQMLVKAWNRCKGKALYCDTDSLHIRCTPDELPKDLDPVIDKDNTGALGLWKVEGEFIKARYIRAKTYVEVKKDGTPIFTCAGAPPQVKELMTWDNFRVGFNAWDVAKKTGKDYREHSKLTPKQYPSGVALEYVNFEING